MDLLFHTIAVEPARWTPQRTSRSLAGLLPDIAAAGFKRIEVFEPHLAEESQAAGILEAFQSLGLTPEILSSYVNLNPAVTSLEQVKSATEEMRARIEYFGFRKVRIFPGPAMKPADTAAAGAFIKRLERLVASLPGVELLLETHDVSLADDPELITQIVRDLAAPSVGLLYQPTLFNSESALRQFAIQQPFIRHVHLQNRNADRSFARLRDGVLPWNRIIPQLDPGIAGTLEFVPVGICPVDKFDLAAVLAEARSEADYVRGLTEPQR